ncbi:MAG: glutamate--tRNA ligase, partial [Chloroflexi bacterium]|nr:glutamate--tRNA ligase [Chloroflexota bacterium]
AAMTEGFFTEELVYDASDLLPKRMKNDPAGARDALRAAKASVEALAAWEHEALEAALRSLAEERGMKAGDLFMLLRVAVTGRPISPPLFESMEVLGRERCLRRIDEAAERLAT